MGSMAQALPTSNSTQTWTSNTPASSPRRSPATQKPLMVWRKPDVALGPEPTRCGRCSTELPERGISPDLEPLVATDAPEASLLSWLCTEVPAARAFLACAA